MSHGCRGLPPSGRFSAPGCHWRPYYPGCRHERTARLTLAFPARTGLCGAVSGFRSGTGCSVGLKGLAGAIDRDPLPLAPPSDALGTVLAQHIQRPIEGHSFFFAKPARLSGKLYQSTVGRDFVLA
jgi:hypothetical protein